MQTPRSQPHHESVGLIEALMEQERLSVDLHRQQATLATEPKMKSLFTKLAELHVQSYAELRLFLNDVRSQDEITQQINDMFL